MRMTLVFRIPLILLAITLMAGRSGAQSTVFAEWTAQFNTPAGFGRTNAITADGQGNSYVTGEVDVGTASSPNNEMLTVKYDANGHQLWQAFLGSPVHQAEGVSLALDSVGNVYVLGSLELSSTKREFATAKYSPNGVRLWVNFYEAPLGYNVPAKIAVSAGGDVYVTGYSQVNNSTTSDLAALTIKYSTNGTQLWLKTIPPSKSINEAVRALDLGLDSQENVYVLISDFTSSQIHFAYVNKYDANGNLLKASIGSSDLGTPFAFHVDSQGHSYVAGGGSPAAPNGAEDSIVAKYNPDGSKAWVDNFGPEPTGGFDQTFGPVDMTVDPAGHVFVAYTLPTSVGANISVLKVNSTGAKQWQTQYNGHADKSGFDSARALAVNSAGLVYVTGTSNDPDLPQGRGNDLTTIKYSGTGQQIWVQRYDGRKDAFARAMTIGGDGGLFVAGYVETASTGQTNWITIDYVQDAAKTTPTTLTFVSQKVSQRSSPQPVTLTNTSDTDLNITSIGTSGDFQHTSNCPPSLGAGASCTIEVTFTPTTIGQRTGSLSIVDQWEGSPEVLPLTGTGIS